MKMLLSGAAVLGFVAGAGYIAKGGADGVGAVSSSHAPPARAATYRLKRAGLGDECTVFKGPGRAGTGGGDRLRLVGACSGLAPGLSNARYWRDDADGDVAFVDEAGRPVVEFFAADGVSYESFAPKTPLLLLDRSD